MQANLLNLVTSSVRVRKLFDKTLVPDRLLLSSRWSSPVFAFLLPTSPKDETLQLDPLRFGKVNLRMSIRTL